MTVCGSPPPTLSPDKPTAGDDQSDISSAGPNPMSNPSDGQEMEGVVMFDPGPRPRVMPKEAICFTMTIGPSEVAGPNPMLRLSVDDAYYLTDSDELQMDPPIVFSRDLLVIDSSNRHYMMNLSNRETESPVQFLLNTEWGEFARTNRLRENDTLMFYKFLHNATGRSYYRLDFFKVPKTLPTSGDPADDESCCLSLTLTASQVDPLDPMFLIDEQDAYDLTGDDMFLGSIATSFSQSLHICDDYKGMVGYVFELSAFFANKCFVGYRISGGWASFVQENGLAAGDRIFFLLHQENKTKDLIYVLKFIRKNPLPSDDVYTFEEVTSEEKKRPAPKMKPGPVPSMPVNNVCLLSRALTAFEVVHAGGKPRLFLDSFSASFFMGPYGYGTLRENLVMFDDRDRQYDMLLSYFGTKYEDMVYVIDGGWQRFVKVNNLKAGDRIEIYKMPKNRFRVEPCYVIKFVRKIYTSVGRGVSVARPSGSGTGQCGSGGDPARSNGLSSRRGKGIVIA